MNQNCDLLYKLLLKLWTDEHFGAATIQRHWECLRLWLCEYALVGGDTQSLLSIWNGVKQPSTCFFCGVTIVGVFCHPLTCKADSHGLQGASANKSADCWVLPSLIMPLSGPDYPFCRLYHGRGPLSQGGPRRSAAKFFHAVLTFECSVYA